MIVKVKKISEDNSAVLLEHSLIANLAVVVQLDIDSFQNYNYLFGITIQSN